jgi:hypothetical protein
MDIAHSMALFLHILGAFALAVANGLELLLLRGLSHGRASDFPAYSEQYRLLPALGGGGLAVILLTGLFLMFTGLGAQVWIVTALVTVVVIGALGAWSGIPLRRAMLAASGAPSDETRLAALRDWRFGFSNRLRIALMLGILALMVFKPDAVGTAVAMIIAAGAALAWAAAGLSSRTGTRAATAPR